MMTGALFAQQGPQARIGAKEAMIQPGLKDYLHLTEDQISSMRAVHTEMRETLKPLVQNLAAKTRVLRQESRKATPDNNVIAQLKGEIADLQAQIKSQREYYFTRVRGLLNSDQVASLADLEQAFSLFPMARAAAAFGLIKAPAVGYGKLDPLDPPGRRSMQRGRGGI
jgi:hypothetical protein